MADKWSVMFFDFNEGFPHNFIHFGKEIDVKVFKGFLAVISI